MIVTKTTFNNFRCFKEYELHYGSQTTVFIGKNGSGKSSILSAIKRGLSFMFVRSKSFRHSLTTSNNARVRSYGLGEANFDPISRRFNYPIKNDFYGLFNARPIDWSFQKNTENAPILASQYSEALNTVLLEYNEVENLTLPVLLVISDSFPHQEIDPSDKMMERFTMEVVPRDLAYYGWDERASYTKLWLERYYKISDSEQKVMFDIDALEQQIDLYQARIGNKDDADKDQLTEWQETIEQLEENLERLKNDKRKQSFSREKEYIHKKLIGFTATLEKNYDFINEDFQLYRIATGRTDTGKSTMEFSFKDGRVMAFNALPMGYRRIFAIVIDIAYRSYILNEGTESSGIVLIDEIELHLHPTLQQEVLQRLRTIFPKIQFIVTTHSPLIISNFAANKDNLLIKLEQEGNKYVNKVQDNLYGLNYATNLSKIMETAPRSSTIDRYIDGYLFQFGRNKKKEAGEILDKLREYIGGELPKALLEEIEEKKKDY